MAAPGQLKAKIDLVKKKISEKGATLAPERRRQLHKRLRRLQRSRRGAPAAGKKRDPAKAAATKAGEKKAPQRKTAGETPPPARPREAVPGITCGGRRPPRA